MFNEYAWALCQPGLLAQENCLVAPPKPKTLDATGGDQRDEPRPQPCRAPLASTKVSTRASTRNTHVTHSLHPAPAPCRRSTGPLFFAPLPSPQEKTTSSVTRNIHEKEHPAVRRQPVRKQVDRSPKKLRYYTAELAAGNNGSRSHLLRHSHRLAPLRTHRASSPAPSAPPCLPVPARHRRRSDTAGHPPTTSSARQTRFSHARLSPRCRVTGLERPLMRPTPLHRLAYPNNDPG